MLDMRPYKERSLGVWMLGCENSLCTDLRDHVYGLLGLAYGCDMIANYSITLEQLYIAVMRDPGRNGSDGIPGWLIDGLVREKFGFDPPKTEFWL